MFSTAAYTAVPNEAIDELMLTLTGAEFKVLMVVLRQTLGWHRDSLPFSSSWVAKLARINRETAIQALDSLVKRELLSEGAETQQGRIYSVNFANRQVHDYFVAEEGSRKIRLAEAGTEAGVVGKSDPKKESNTNTNVLERREPRSLRERVLSALAEARRQPEATEDKSSATPLPLSTGRTPQARQMAVLVSLWDLLFGTQYRPDYGMFGKMVSLYGGFQHGGPERLAAKMLDLAGRDVAGGPANIIMSEARKNSTGIRQEAKFYGQPVMAPSLSLQTRDMDIFGD